MTYVKGVGLSFQRTASAFGCVLRGLAGDVVVVGGRVVVSNNGRKKIIIIIIIVVDSRGDNNNNMKYMCYQ